MTRTTATSSDRSGSTRRRARCSSSSTARRARPSGSRSRAGVTDHGALTGLARRRPPAVRPQAVRRQGSRLHRRRRRGDGDARPRRRQRPRRDAHGRLHVHVHRGDERRGLFVHAGAAAGRHGRLGHDVAGLRRLGGRHARRCSTQTASHRRRPDVLHHRRGHRRGTASRRAAGADARRPRVTDETTWGIAPAVGAADTEQPRQDHTHGSPAEPAAGGGRLLGSATRRAGSPIIFGDLLLTEAGDDFLYADARRRPT